MRPRRGRAGWPAAVLAVAGALILVACGPPGAPEIEPSPVGTAPLVTRTDTGPTGYSVTFRYDAPDDATEVHLIGETYFTAPEAIGGPETGFAHDARLGDEWRPGDVAHPLMMDTPAPMTLDEASGLWEITTAIPAGAYSYGFVVGPCTNALLCASEADPANPPVLGGAEGATGQHLSQIFIPTHPSFPTYELDYQGFPFRGEVLALQFDDAGVVGPGAANHLGVYLPPDYDPDRADPYRLLVLSHGAGDDETSWFSQGRAANIVEQAIASGAIEDTVVVTTNFYDFDEGSTEADTTLYAAYAAALRELVLPVVERELNISAARADRAFGGMSMGGGIATHLLHEETDLFGYYGIWSGARLGMTDRERADLPRLETALGIHIGTGLQDRVAGIGAGSLARASGYRSLGLRVVEHDVDGGHTWPVWRDMLHDFLTTVAFRDVPAAS